MWCAYILEHVRWQAFVRPFCMFGPSIYIAVWMDCALCAAFNNITVAVLWALSRAALVVEVIQAISGGSWFQSLAANS